MADLVLFGVPNGFSSSKCDAQTDNFLQLFYVPHKPGIEMKVYRRHNNDVHYVFLVYEKEGSVFIDADGRSGSFFGMSLIFHNEYIGNTANLYKLFQQTYDKYIKNQIIIERPNGVRQHKFETFNVPDDKIAEYVVRGMTSIIKQNPELNFMKDRYPLPPPQNQTER